MIDPDNVTQYDAPKEWKEEFMLFCATVAGKSAFQQAQKLDQMLTLSREWIAGWGDFTPEQAQAFSPFRVIQELWEYNGLMNALKYVKLGQYRRLYNVFLEMAKLDVDTCTVEDLEAIPGVGPKTARFFIVHTRPGARYAILDTHILAHLAELRTPDGHPWYTGVPKSTPTSPSIYARAEAAALQQAYIAGLTPAEWDLQTWKSRRKERK